MKSKGSLSLSKQKNESASSEVADVDSTVVTKAKKDDRGQWNNGVEFVLSCLGYAMGLGNVWKFPYTCFSNGGGAYLIPYVIVLALIGIPTFFLELIMGQYSGKGPIEIWCISPIFKGAGFAMLLISSMICIFYTVILSYCLYYFAMCFQVNLPWDTCMNTYNTPYCYNYREATPCQQQNGTWFNNTCYNQTYLEQFNEVRQNCSDVDDDSGPLCYNYTYNEVLAELQNFTAKRVPSTQEYFFFGVLDVSETIEETGELKWYLVLCLLAMWLLCFAILAKGIKSSGKVVYFSTTFPYLIMLILLIRSALLEGSIVGIKYYLIPTWSRLLDAKVWGDAAGQIFFALSVGCGGLLTYASYNPFHSNLYRNSLMVAIFNSCTDWYAGFVVFSALGYMATILNTDISKVATSGAGLAFVVYPQVTASLPIPQLWSALFFFMLILLGIDSLTAGVEALITATVDRWPSIRRLKILVTAFWCSLFFLLGLPMCTQAGYYWLNLVAYYSSGWTLVVMGIIEIIVFAWIYGAKKVLAHIKEMVGFKLYPHWWVLWTIVSPLVLGAVLVFNLISFTPLMFNDTYMAPAWCQALGWLMTLAPLVIIIAYAIFYVVKTLRQPNVDRLHCCRRFQRMFLPTSEWGPAYDKKESDEGDESSEPRYNKSGADAEGGNSAAGNITEMSQNGSAHFNSINPCFVDDDEETTTIKSETNSNGDRNKSNGLAHRSGAAEETDKHRCEGDGREDRMKTGDKTSYNGLVHRPTVDNDTVFSSF